MVAAKKTRFFSKERRNKQTKNNCLKELCWFHFIQKIRITLCFPSPYNNFKNLILGPFLWHFTQKNLAQQFCGKIYCCYNVMQDIQEKPNTLIFYQSQKSYFGPLFIQKAPVQIFSLILSSDANVTLRKQVRKLMGVKFNQHSKVPEKIRGSIWNRGFQDFTSKISSMFMTLSFSLWIWLLYIQNFCSWQICKPTTIILAKG